MLVLARRVGERVFIGRDIVVTVAEIDRGKVRLGFAAPPNVPVWREEIMPPADGLVTLVPAPVRRTKAQVLRQRANNPGGSGCCERYADMKGCDCLAEAVCEVCGGHGYTRDPSKGRIHGFARCPHGCPVRCSICNNPDCDDPCGKH